MPALRNIFLLFSLFSVHTSYSQSKKIDSLQKIINEGKSDVQTNQTLNRIAVEYVRIDMIKAKDYLYRSIHLANQLKNETSLCGAYSQMVTLQMNLGKIDSAQYYFQLLNKLSANSNSAIVKADLNMTAGLYYKKLGNYKEALPYMISSLNDNIASDKNNSTVATKTYLAGQYLNVGNLFSDLGNYKNAFEYHLKGLKIFEQVGNKRGISFCNQSIAGDFCKIGRYEEAKPYLEKSIELKKELNDKRGIATATAQYGEIYKELKDYHNSIANYNESIKSFHELKLTPDEAKVNSELGKIYVLKKESQMANHYFETAKDLALQAKDSSLLSSIDAAMAAMESSIAMQLKNEQKLMNSLQTSIKLGDKTNELINYQYLIDYYSNNKQFDKAFEYALKLNETSQSVANENLKLQIKQMEQQFNFEKKEKEIALLKKDQELNALALSRQRAIQIIIIVSTLSILIIAGLAINRYRVLNETKRQLEIEKMRNALAQDLHDDVGSALSSISIMSQTPSLLYSERIREQSAQIQERMADIVWAINPMNDSLEKVVMKMKEFAAEILEPKNISYQFKGEETPNGDQLNIEKRKNVFLIFKEAVNNAAKYSQCNEVKIDLSMNNHVLNLTIADNGKGFDAVQEKPGNGLRNMKARAEAIQGKLVIQSDAESGTSVMLQVTIT